jgi:hypothetical protein
MYPKAACPAATYDVAVNLKNRQQAIDGANYGPLNPNEANTEYWAEAADRWDVAPAQAKKQRCGNCAAFIRTPAMLDCIEQGLGNETGNDAWETIKAGVLGYCEAFDFKCAASRTCDAWIVGGPVTKDVSKAMKTEDGEAFPAEAFAYVPDESKPSSWKLRLWDSLADKESTSQVGRAVAALGAGGFRGNRVRIPAGDLSVVKRKVLAAWKRVNPDSDVAQIPEVLKDIGEMNEDEGVLSDDVSGYTSILRSVVEQDGQYCVVSQTGRAFGCYESSDLADQRLAQIEGFAENELKRATVKALIELHDAAHAVDKVTEGVKLVHDLIEDELEAVHKLSFPYSFTIDTKLDMATSLTKGYVSKAVEYRYTLGPAYIPDREDAHGEFADAETLQKAMWDWVRKGDRTIYLQHSEKAAGEMVEMLTWPFPIEAELTVPNQGVTKFTFPADTPFLGVVWEDWAWDLVKAGELRGYSIGGSAKRVEADLPYESKY